MPYKRESGKVKNTFRPSIALVDFFAVWFGAVFVGFVLFKEPEFYWGAFESVFLTEAAVHVTFVAPV